MDGLSEEIFGDAVEAYNRSNEPAPAEDATQDVEGDDLQSPQQGEPAPEEKPVETKPEEETKGEKAGDETAKPEEDGKKINGAKAAREWGEKWEQTAKETQKQLDEVAPVLKLVEEKIGGPANLELAADIYEALKDPATFDPESALDFLSESMPEVAEQLVTHIAQKVVETTKGNALKQAFGRELTADEIKSVQEFLVTGKKGNSALDALLKNTNEELPDELRFDEEGNELPKAVQDHLRLQASVLKETQQKLDQLSNTVTSQTEGAAQEKAAQAVNKYVEEQLTVIDKATESLGLNAPKEGETPEMAAQRKEMAEAIEGLALFYASQDEAFQGMYRKALQAVAANAVKPSKAQSAAAADYSRRIQASMNKFAARAAKFVNPLLTSTAAARTEQVNKGAKAAAQTASASSTVNDNSGGLQDSGDPFDPEAINAAVSDIMRSRHPRS